MVQGVIIDEASNAIININPATGEEISRVQCTSLEEVEAAVKRAEEALNSWSFETTLEKRIELLQEGIKALGAKKDEVAKKMVQEMGKPLSQANEEMGFSTDRGDYWKVLQKALEPQTFGEDEKKKNLLVRHAFGVVGICSPWNFPVDEILLLALPALASGNTVIVKPSEVTPETGAMVVEALASVLPPNVIQFIQGDGKVGAHLTNQDAVRLIAMTGSYATGQILLDQHAAKKRLVLEMGGKDPMIVFADANAEKAAQDAVTYALGNTGQVCCALERIYVAQDIYEPFQAKVVEQASKYKVRNGLQDDGSAPQIGAMVSTLQRDHVQALVKDAVEKGAKLLYKSEIPQTDDKKEGVASSPSFHPVTVLSNVTQEMNIARSETFGPVVVLIPFDGTEKQAIALANDTEYGLGGAVYTKDMQKAQRVAQTIAAGQVGINCYPLDHMDPHCPWVGHKHSGHGFHSGIDGFRQFSIPKTIVVMKK